MDSINLNISFNPETGAASIEPSGGGGEADAVDQTAGLEANDGDGPGISSEVEQYLDASVGAELESQIDELPGISEAKKEAMQDEVDLEYGTAPPDTDSEVGQALESSPLADQVIEFLVNMIMEEIKKAAEEGDGPKDSEQTVAKKGKIDGGGNTGGTDKGEAAGAQNTDAGDAGNVGGAENADGARGAENADGAGGAENTEGSEKASTEEASGAEKADAGEKASTDGMSFFEKLMMVLGELVGKKMEEVVKASEKLNSGGANSGEQFGKDSAALQAATKESAMMSEVLASAAKMGDSLATLVRK